MARRKAEEKKVEVGNVSEVSGEVNIAGRDIYKGYTADQVSVLLTQITTTFQAKPFDGRCPYKGLDVFEEEDAELFFGREKLVEDLVSRVKESRTVFITGPSGSGKSSLVRAGLIHALKQGAIKNLHSERWLYETMKPTREPFIELARVASSFAVTLNAGEDIRTKGLSDATVLAQWCEIALKEGRDKRAVLFIDQFEEVFTQISKEEERVAFINLLTHTATVEDGRVIVLFSMRSDFVSNCATYPQLNALLNQQFIQIGAMQPDELVSAIAQPALRVGLRIDPDLIAQIINDMQGEPGSLPLMQFALKDLFDAEHSKGRMISLTREAYLQRGGIHKSLERHADNAFAKLSTGEQELARSIFGGLIEIGRGTQDTRRTAVFEELIPVNAKDKDVQVTVQKLADARLITTDEQAGKDTVTISHEKLIDAWPWLKKLVNDNRDSIALQNEIANDAKEWEEHGRDASYLYTGARLVSAREQLARKNLVLSGLAQEFVQASHARQRRGQVSLIAGVSAIIVLLVIAVIIFSWQSNKNAELARQAGLRELAAQSALLRGQNLQTSLLLGVEVFNRWKIPQTHGVLLDNVQSHPYLRQFLSAHVSPIRSIAFSPDGQTLASGSDDGTIILWDVETNQPIGQPLRAHNDSVTSVAFHPNGQILASGSDDGTVLLWEVSSLRNTNVTTHQPVGQSLIGHALSVRSIAFSPDGRILASGSDDSTIRLWDVSNIFNASVTKPQAIGPPLIGHTGAIYSLTFRPDGQILASGSGDSTIRLWDVSNIFNTSVTKPQAIGPPLTGHIGAIYSLAFRPDGQILASGSGDRTIILWDVSTVLSTSVETGQPVGQPLPQQSSRVSSLAFSRDGKILASGSDGSVIILWDVSKHQAIGQPLTGHTGPIYSLAMSPDGKTLASGGFDKSIILWDASAMLSTRATKPQAIGLPLREQTGSIYSLAISPDGQILASGAHDKTIILWDVSAGLNTSVATHPPIGQPLIGHAFSVYSIAFSPDGQLLASWSEDGTILLWDVASLRNTSVTTHQPIGQPLIERAGSVRGIAFSPDGQLLASGSDDRTILLWDVASLRDPNVTTHQPIGQPLHPLSNNSSQIYSLAFSPDGKILASGSQDGTILLWDVSAERNTSVTTQEPIGEPLARHSGEVYSLAFSPDGKILASGGKDQKIFLWDVSAKRNTSVTTQEPIGKTLTGHSSWVSSLAFSPDGKMLVSGGADSTIILWDVETGQPIGQPLAGHTGSIYSIAMSPDGKMLASGSADNSIILWNLDPQAWISKTCQRVGRNFTQAEWEQYFRNETYRRTCPQWSFEQEVSPSPSSP